MGPVAWERCMQRKMFVSFLAGGPRSRALQHEEEADRFEAQYNFRFEEPGANELATFPRPVGGALEGSARQPVPPHPPCFAF